MVFETIVADLLNRFLGDYVQNFDSSQLKLGIWGGDVVLKELDVKESALDDLDLPIRVVSGHLGRLELKIPWSNMYTAPVRATIKGLYVVVIPNLAVKYDPEKEEEAAFLAKQAELTRIEEEKIKSLQKGKDEKVDTFTEKLVTQIIKNLQVSINDIHVRYEDSVSDKRNPFSFGFTLHNLSFETTNEKWIPTIIQENVSKIHKLVTLDSLAFYWNSNTVLYSLFNPIDRQAELEKTIATSSSRPQNIAYMLGPINSTAQLRLNSKPELDNFKIPKVWLNVVMEEIAIGLSKRQYQDLMKLLEALDRMTVASLYRKYRPDVPHAGHAKEWWQFAINAILEEEIRRKVRNWSWEHMREHRNHIKQYKNLYVTKLTSKKLSSDVQKQICECEKKLDLFNITVARKQAELEAQLKPRKKKKKFKRLRRAKDEEPKPRSWGSWVGGWFSHGPRDETKDGTAGQNIVKQFEEAMTQEEKAKLYEAIGYQDQPIITEYPKEFVESNLAFLLHNLTLTLSDDTAEVPQVLKANSKDVSASVLQRPSAHALSVDAKIQSFIVHGVPSDVYGIPVVVSSQDVVNHSDLPLLDVQFETNPLDQSCDSRCYVYAQPLQIIYDALTANRLVEVFTPPEQVDLHQLQATAMLKLEEMKEMSAFGLQYAIEHHKYLDLKVDMKPVFVIIPHNGIYKDNIDLIVVSLGYFKVGSHPRDPNSPSIKSMVKAGSTEEEVLDTMLASAYDKFNIAIEDAEIILVPPEQDWKEAVMSKNSDLHLLYPLSLKVDLHKSIVSVDPRMPKMKVTGELPLLELSISDVQLFDVLKIATSIPLPDTEKSVSSAPVKSKSVVAAVDVSNVNAKVLYQAKREAIETYKTSSSESEERDVVVATDSSSVQCTDIELKFEISSFVFAISHQVSKSASRTLKFSFKHFGTDVIMRTFDMSADIYLGTLLLEHYYTPTEPAIKLMSSSISNHKSNLFSMSYLQANKKGPDFATKYNSILQFVIINVKDMNFILHQECILSIMEFSNKLLSKLDEFSTLSAAASSVEQSEGKTIKSVSTVGEITAAKGKTVHSKKKKESVIIDMKIQAGLDAITVLICNSQYDLTDIQVKGMNTSVVMDKMKTSVTASLKDIVVNNPKQDALYPKMMISEAGEVLDLSLVMYNDATDDENYVNLSAVDMAVAVNLGRTKIVFLNSFVQSLLNFLDHFQDAKNKVAEASAVAAEVAKLGMEQAYEQASRILLNVTIHAPVIIIPQNSTSKNTVVADLGTLNISNKFEFGNKRNELGIPAILDNMVLNLHDLKLSRALVNPKVNQVTAECLLLEPVTFTVAVVRNLASGWYNDLPEVDGFASLAALKMSLSQEDYVTVMSILSENLAESPETVSEHPPKLPGQRSLSVGASVKHTVTSETAHLLAPGKIKEKDIIPLKVYPRFKFAFEMECATAIFYTGKTELTKRTNVRDSCESMATVNVQTISVDVVMSSSGTTEATVILSNFILDDTRTCRRGGKGITRLMERLQHSGSNNMVSVNFQQNSQGENMVDVKISSFTLIACLPYILKLAEFFSQVGSSESKPLPVESEKLPGVAVAKPSESKTSQASVSTSTGVSIISVTVERPDIVLIENIEDIDSSAVFLNNEIKAKMTISESVTAISGKLSNLTFYTASFNPLRRAETTVKILSPSEIDLQCNMKKESSHIDILFKDLLLQITPGTVEILTNILSAFTTEKTEVQKEVVKSVEDLSELWKVRRLQSCSFWFLDTLCGRERAVEATENLIDVSEAMFIPTEQLLFTLRKVIITVEAGVGSRTVPMLLLESSFQAQICDWSSDVNLESTLSIEISYYNEKIAVWEPLLEPVETEKGHRSWELFMEMSKVVDVEPVDERLEPLPAPTKFEIKSDDVMELTVSRTCLDVLTNLSEAFGEAVKLTSVKEEKLPYAPYRVYNYLGLPITIILRGLFKVLHDKQEYSSVILESGSPPLHLTEDSKISGTTARYSVLKKQFVKDDKCFNVKIVTEDMNVERRISIACTDKRYFKLPRRTYPGDQWGFVVDVKSVYGCKVITFHSHLMVHNHFTIEIDIYYLVAHGANEVKYCGTVQPNDVIHVPMHAVYTVTSELFLRPKDMSQAYTVSLEPFAWKTLIDNPNATKVVHCLCKDTKGHSFFINVAGEVERIYFEETSKKTVGSSVYKINLYPTVRFRNLLLYPINYSLQGLDKDFCVLEGETNELWSAQIGKTAMEIRLNNYLDKTWTCCKTLSADVDELSVWTFTATVGDRVSTLELGMHTQNIGGSLVMELYSPYCMINKTGLLLIYRDEEGNVIYHPPEVQKPVLFSFKAKAFFSKKKVSLKIKDSDWSDKFSVDAVGSSGNVIAKGKNGQSYGIGVQIRLSQSGLTKMIIFTPFYILVNSCDFDIECQEVRESSGWVLVRKNERENEGKEVDGTLSEWIRVNKRECVPFWPVDTAKAEMIVRYCGDSVDSDVFSFKDSQNVLLRLDSKRGGIHVDCQVAQSSIILTFDDYVPGHAAALLVNHMAEYTVSYCQSGCKEERNIYPYTCVLYCWEKPVQKRILNWKCGEAFTDALLVDGIGEFHPEPGVNAYWLSFLDGMQRVLVFTHDVTQAFAVQAAVTSIRMDTEFLILIQGVGLSLVDSDNDTEIMYMGITSTGIIWEGKKERSGRFKPLCLRECITLENAYQRYQNEMKIGCKPSAIQTVDSRLEVNFKELKMLKPSVKLLKRHFQTGLWVEYKTSPGVMHLHAKINRLQIDNQLADCVFPVVLSPVPPPKSIAAETAPKPFTELSIRLKKDDKSSVQQIKYGKILIQEFHVKLDQGLINSMISFFTPEQPTGINYVKIMSIDKELAESRLKDVAAIYSSQEQKCYFDILHFSPLKMHISFSMTGAAAKDDNKPTPIHSDFLNLLLQSVGVTLTEVQDVIFKLDYFERKHAFMSMQQLVNEATSHYVGQAVKQLYMLVLGLDVIGNPVGLILGLGEGVTDLFYEPFQGAIMGPEEFFEGLGLGVKSLFGHAVGGVAGAASRITGTLGKGLAALTLDKDYQKRRRQNLNPHTQDAGQRFAQGGKGLFMGVFDGVTGVVTKPIEGAREEGVGGFFKGVGKGLIGVVTRPTAGAVDFVSGSFESVKKITELHEEVKRLRAPRFIRSDHVIRPYVRKESEGSLLLQLVEKGKYASTDVYEAHIPVGIDGKSFLLVTNNRVMYISKGDVFGQWNAEWEYRWDELKGVPTVTESGIRIMLLEPQKRKMNIFGSKVAGKLVHALDQQQCLWIVSKIEEIMKSRT